MPSENLKTFKVGTFYDGRHFSAYTIWYNNKWSGCIEYQIKAVNGTTAKKLAIKRRRKHESGKEGESPTCRRCSYPVAYEGDWCGECLCEDDGY